jgi:hypothetical protein
LQTLEDEDVKRSLEMILSWNIGQYAKLRIAEGVIRSGSFPTQEFSLVSATRDGNYQRGPAFWHEDVGDPGDMNEVVIGLKQVGKLLYLWMYETDSDRGDAIVLERIE